ncbi:hypothetical protein FSP39_012392 [Pinctada imbricata]|uniref:Uncharacterized protein n=1 Tax=Pinctada imbricata TaxID=66713 RepID=A0AA89BKU6_PINIB|nr:hypothetical protein FSP39_012392 [Pinctada imbricata]
MACSGIAEHNEARRKGRREELRAFLKKQLLEKLEDSADLPEQSTYEREFNVQKRCSPGLISASPHNAAFVDQQRRELIRQQQMVEYTAKLPKRFSVSSPSALLNWVR